jgi:Methylamine utilization protein MauJ
LRFHTRTSDPIPLGDFPTPETVVIEFESRELVWHALGDSEAPTVTTIMRSGDEFDPLFSLILRFLSAVAFACEIEAAAYRFGAHAETNATHPASSREPYGVPWAPTIMLAPSSIEVANDDRLRLALALYREGASTRSKYLAFMALWSVIQAAHDGNESAVDAYLNSETSTILHAKGGVNAYIASVLKTPHTNPPKDIAAYLRDHGRDAIAHVVRRKPAMTHINPDDLDDRFGLDADTYLLHALARNAIEQRWPGAVMVAPRG